MEALSNVLLYRFEYSIIKTTEVLSRWLIQYSPNKSYLSFMNSLTQWFNNVEINYFPIKPDILL